MCLCDDRISLFVFRICRRYFDKKFESDHKMNKMKAIIIKLYRIEQYFRLRFCFLGFFSDMALLSASGM